jgi:nickel-type superoxide dismutase maturation protease
MCRLLRVTENSLWPVYGEGDFVFVSKIPFLFSPPAPGDIVVLRHPQHGTLIKQVKWATAEQVFVVGTQQASLDSRVFGPVARRTLVGKVIASIHNPDRI